MQNPTETAFLADDVELRTTLLIAEYYAQSLRPPNGDPIIANFSSAMVQVMQNPDARAFEGGLIQERPEKITPSYRANLALRAFIAWYIQMDPVNPEIPETVEDWLPDIEATVFHAGPRQDQYKEIMTTFNTESNVTAREIIKVLVPYAYRGRFDGPVDILDVGCSLNLGNKRLKKLDRFPFDYIEYGTTLTPDKKKVPRLNVYPDLTSILNYAAKQPTINNIVGVDKSRPNDRRWWPIAGSLYPSERKDALLAQRFNQLMNLGRVAGVNFVHGDFLDMNNGKLPGKHGQKKFDIVSLITMEYQHSAEEEQQIILENALRFLKPNGLIVVQDFANINPQNPLKLDFPDSWFNEPFLYKAMIFDPLEPEKGFQLFIQWINGRCSKGLADASSLIMQKLHILHPDLRTAV